MLKLNEELYMNLDFFTKPVDGDDLAGEHRSANYYDRNRAWLTPLVATLMLVISFIAMREVGAGSGFVIPDWIQKVAIAIGCFGVGLGSMLTRTVSAQIVQAVGIIAVLALVFISLA